MTYLIDCAEYGGASPRRIQTGVTAGNRDRMTLSLHSTLSNRQTQYQMTLAMLSGLSMMANVTHLTQRLLELCVELQTSPWPKIGIPCMYRIVHLVCNMKRYLSSVRSLGSGCNSIMMDREQAPVSPATPFRFLGSCAPCVATSVSPHKVRWTDARSYTSGVSSASKPGPWLPLPFFLGIFDQLIT